MIATRRFSLGMLMTIIVLLAADLAAVKDAYARGYWPYPVLLVITLPMANLMLLGATRIRADRTTWRFWLAFEITAVLLIGLSIYLDLNYKYEFLKPVS